MTHIYIYNCVIKQTNIISEVSKMKMALKPYADILGNHEPDVNQYVPLFMIKDTYVDYFKTCKSKVFYECLSSVKCKKPIVEVCWNNVIDRQDKDFKNVYKMKFIDVKDNKLAEFNFKVLYNILPCNVNLVRWKKKECAKCNICNVNEDILHLLFNCRYASTIWADFCLRTGITVIAEDVLFGKEDISKTDNIMINLIAYLIYKKWLLESLNNVPRQLTDNLNNFKADLVFKKSLYKYCKWYEYVEAIELSLNV